MLQAVTRELKEQQLMLQAARDELKRLKQDNENPQAPPLLTSSTPELSQATLVEKKQSNHAASNNGIIQQQVQSKRWQLEDMMRKVTNMRVSNCYSSTMYLTSVSIQRNFFSGSNHRAERKPKWWARMV